MVDAMETLARRTAALVVVLVAMIPAVTLVADVADALLTTPDAKCQETIAKEGLRFVTSLLKVEQRCRDASLHDPGVACVTGSTDPGADGYVAARTKLVTKLGQRVAAACGASGVSLAHLEFPGRCADANPGDGFTAADLADCLVAGSRRVLRGVCFGGSNDGEACDLLGDCPDAGPGASCVGLVPTEYDPTFGGPSTSAAIACQTGIGRAASKFFAAYLKAVHRCRHDLLQCRFAADGELHCALEGVEPAHCATNDPGTAEAIARAREQARVRMLRACADDASVVAIHACDPDQPTGEAAAACELDAHARLAEHFIAVEFPPTPVCGDGRVNAPNEECDGVNGACPGQCGTPGGPLACLCQNVARTLVIEAAEADLDLGWTGLWHDSHLSDGGGYLADLQDCDGPAGPDTVCQVGPSCSGAPHAPCSPLPDQPITGDAICAAAGQGVCRTTAGAATGPHCAIEFQRRCQNDTQCPAFGDSCVRVSHGPPLPLAAGGISLCVVPVFSEDVVGSTDLATGAGAVRLRERVATYPGYALAQPCPVCGGFCAGVASTFSPGYRDLCSSDQDCPDSHCVTDLVCSFGARIDQACRVQPLVGGPTALFGSPSTDCPPEPSGALTSLDLLLAASTTATTQLARTEQCTAPDTHGQTCVGGANDGRPCDTVLDCPGGACRLQCFCPGQERPNACHNACVGGANDAAPCATDAECDPPAGFCHPADCRLDAADTDSVQEGACTVAPTNDACSVHTFVPCASDAACQAPACPSCDPGETCVARQRACFVNDGIARAGHPGVPDRVTAATFCLPSSGWYIVDLIAGLPGPGALTQPETVVPLGF